MIPEENQTQENITGENSVSAPPKQEVVEGVPVVEETTVPTETATEEKIVSAEQIENQTEQVEILEEEVVESITEIPVVGIVNEDAGLPQPSEMFSPENISEGLAKTTIEETTQVKTPPTTPTQEIPVQPQIKTIEKIIYQTPPNFIQNLLNKARAKIQEKKRKKLDKIISLFELNPEISNSDIQKLLRTTKRSATRYLNQLEKEQKITQVGVKGRSVKYTKKQ